MIHYQRSLDADSGTRGEERCTQKSERGEERPWQKQT